MSKQEKIITGCSVNHLCEYIVLTVNNKNIITLTFQSLRDADNNSNIDFNEVEITDDGKKLKIGEYIFHIEPEDKDDSC